MLQAIQQPQPQKKSGVSSLKVPPQDIDIERAILGACLTWPDARAKVKCHLVPDDFYREAHSAIWSAICSLAGECDAQLVKVALEKAGNLEKVGGIEYLIDLMSQVVTKAGLDQYCRVILDCSTRRKVIQASSVMAEQAFQPFTDIEEIISTAKDTIRGLNVHEEKAYRKGKDLIKVVFEEMEKRCNNQDPMVGISWGIDGLDKLTGGAEPKTLTYLCGRPSMGKTALALHMADHMASLNQGFVVYFANEGGAESLTRRRLSAQSGVSLGSIRYGRVHSDDHWGWLLDAANKLSDRQFIIVDHSRFKDIGAMVSFTETLAMEHRLAAVFGDHIQLMRAKNQRWNSRHHEISYISNSLKDLAKDLCVPVIELCQLNRLAEGIRPNLSHLKESGDLEQDGDIIFGIYRDTKESRKMELGCMKGRDVGTWVIDLVYDVMTQRIMEVKDDPEQYFNDRS